MARAVPAAAESLQQSVQLRVGGYFPESKSFDAGTGIDLIYSVKPFPYAAVDAGIGYFRAEDGNAAYISALPVTVSARAILPLQYVNVYAGGGIGVYYKMLQLELHDPHLGTGMTELPADQSEFSFGYHAGAGIEIPTTNGLSLLLDCKYVFVNQGKFKSYDIKHDGAFVYGGFALNF